MTCNRILKLTADLVAGVVKVKLIATDVVQVVHTCPTDPLTGFDSIRVVFACTVGSDVMTLLATGMGAALQIDSTTLRIRPTVDANSLLVYVPSTVSSAELGKLAIGLTTQVTLRMRSGPCPLHSSFGLGRTERFLFPTSHRLARDGSLRFLPGHQD
jgi:hypothetical protein